MLAVSARIERPIRPPEARQHWVADMGWAVPHYSKTKVDAAGDTLIAAPAALDANGRDEALTIINNWRSSHSYPLQAIKMTLRTRAKEKIDNRAIVAQRIKRLSSIESKLRRFDSMKLS